MQDKGQTNSGQNPFWWTRYGQSLDIENNGQTDFLCNCDANVPEWAADDGFITVKEILPLTEVFYGPLLYDIERANFTIGRLKCSGKIFNMF